MAALTSSEDARVFKLLDNYSGRQHHCFVAEMFLNDSETEYILCFRPARGNIDSPNRYACRYLEIGTDEAKTAAKRKYVPVSISELLDRELPALGQLI